MPCNERMAFWMPAWPLVVLLLCMLCAQSVLGLGIWDKDMFRPDPEGSLCPGAHLEGCALNDELSKEFPPGPRPPGGRFKYIVEFANPPTAVLFFGFPRTLHHHRNETAIEAVIRDAMIDACDPAKREDFMRGNYYEWNHWGGSEFIGLEPERVVPAMAAPPALVGPTWGIWTNALVGINRFRIAYPNLDFQFRVFVQQGGYEEFCAAFGKLLDLSPSNGADGEVFTG